jgi:hypothetical protein
LSRATRSPRIKNSRMANLNNSRGFEKRKKKTTPITSNTMAISRLLLARKHFIKITRKNEKNTP